MQRRQFLLTSVAMSGAAMAAGFLFSPRAESAEGTFKVAMSEEAWRAKLTPDQFTVLREAGTERPYSSRLNDTRQAGTYTCAGCDTPLYSSATKFDSGTGWPSFWDAIPGATGTTTDYKLIYARTEVHCATCGGHLGHIFEDGPAPTGKRHCINGVALGFQEGAAA